MWEWLTLLAAAEALFLGLFAVTRSADNPLAQAYASLGIVTFAWVFAHWAFQTSGSMLWKYLDWTASPWSLPALCQLVLVFVGKARSLRWLQVLLVGLATVVSLASATAFFSDWGRSFGGSLAWDLAVLVPTLPTLCLLLWLLHGHIRRQEDATELLRSRLLAWTVALGALFGAYDVLTPLDVVLPWTLVTTTLSGVVVLRLELLGDELRLLVLANVAALTLFTAVILVALAFYVDPAPAVATFAALVIACTLAAVLFWTRLRPFLRQRDATRRFAVLGRMAGQLAHDLKNPLSATRGALQFLQEERARGRSLDPHDAFLDLLLRENERMTRLVERYQSLDNPRPRRSAVDLNALVVRVTQLQRLAEEPQLELSTDLQPALPACLLDEDLVASALENLIQNAREAMPQGGRLRIHTRAEPDAGAPRRVVVAVEDNGCGMDARVAERAEDFLFSTKRRGSGLGLAMVKRVVAAHGGELSIRSRLDRGTAVRMEFPASVVVAHAESGQENRDERE